MRSGLKKLSSFRTLKDFKENVLNKTKKEGEDEGDDEGKGGATAASSSFPGIGLRTSLPGGLVKADSSSEDSPSTLTLQHSLSASAGELPSINVVSSKETSSLKGSSGGSHSANSSPSSSHHGNTFRPSFRASLRMLSPFKEPEVQQPASSPFPGISLHVVAQKTVSPPTSDVLTSSSTESSSDSEEEEVADASVAFPGINFHIVENKDSQATTQTVAPAPSPSPTPEEELKDRRKSRSNLFGVDAWKKYRKETLSSAFKKNINFAPDSKDNAEDAKKVCDCSLHFWYRLLMS